MGVLLGRIKMSENMVSLPVLKLPSTLNQLPAPLSVPQTFAMGNDNRQQNKKGH